MEIAAKANVIDFLFLILGLRIVYIAVSRGFIRESFKITGLLLGSFFAFQYYSFFSNNINLQIPFLNREYLYFLSFLTIFLGIGMAFSLLRLMITVLFKKKETSSSRSKWGLVLMGGFRAVFLSSIIIFLLSLSPLNPTYYQKSISCSIFKNVAAKIYLASFRIYKKFNSKSISNNKVKEYCESFDIRE